MGFVDAHRERAENLNQGFSLVRKAMALLERIDSSLLQLVRVGTDRERNALSEGITAGQVTVGPAGIAQDSWHAGPHVLEANPERRGAQLTNTSAAGGPSITLGLGQRQPTPGSGIVLAPGATWDGRISGMVWTGSIAPVASAAGATLAFAEV